MQFGWPAQQGKKHQKMVFVICKTCRCKTETIYQMPYQAWAEGKRNAEVETLRAAIDEALDKREPKAVEVKPKTTWGEFLCNIGLIHDCTESEEVVLRLFNNIIPADIAEKLGIEPKEG